jgi:hypothetical protein
VRSQWDLAIWLWLSTSKFTCRVLAAVLRRGYFIVLKFGIPILLNGPLTRKWKLGGFVSWKSQESG